MSLPSALDRRRVLALLLGGVLLRPSVAWADDDDDDDDEDDDGDDEDRSGRNRGRGGDDDEDRGGDDDGGDGDGDGDRSGSDSGSGRDDGEGDESRSGDRDRADSSGGARRGRASGDLRDITVLYPDGWVERIDGGVYELIDPRSRQVVRRAATSDDVARMMALR